MDENLVGGDLGGGSAHPDSSRFSDRCFRIFAIARRYAGYFWHRRPRIRSWRSWSLWLNAAHARWLRLVRSANIRGMVGVFHLIERQITDKLVANNGHC